MKIFTFLHFPRIFLLIIPPKEYVPRKEGYDDFLKFRVNIEPLCQAVAEVSHSTGLYQQVSVALKSKMERNFTISLTAKCTRRHHTKTTTILSASSGKTLRIAVESKAPTSADPSPILTSSTETSTALVQSSTAVAKTISSRASTLLIYILAFG